MRKILGKVRPILMPGKQYFELFHILCGWQCLENVVQVDVGLDAVGLCGFDQAVKAGRNSGTILGVGKQPVAEADDHHAVILPISSRL